MLMGTKGGASVPKVSPKKYETRESDTYGEENDRGAGKREGSQKRGWSRAR